MLRVMCFMLCDKIMYLEKLEIQGFKSFARKNMLVFPGMLDKSKRGITAVVGPNGSGKSNIADSVRWALGEQSMKTLRGKKSEDIIFSGSDKKSRLSMAEVSLFLNNRDKKAPIDYSEVVVTRRLYRNGDSEYMINNSRVRLADIQMMLAKAKFGQKTYSVIGQGMVEGFLNTTLAERKEFFDEATGVKQYQIKRDDSLNKLRASYENLVQAQMLLSEIEPRLKSLTRQVNRLKKRGEIEGELKKLQLKYYRRIWHEINDKFNEYNKKFLELEKVKFSKDKKLTSINHELSQLEVSSAKENEFVSLQNELSKAQNEKDEINKRLAKIEAQMEVKLEANGQFDLSFLLNKKEELAKESKNIEEEISSLERNVKYDREKGESLDKDKEKLDKELEKLNSSLVKASPQADSDDLKKVNRNLNEILGKIRSLDSESDISRIKGIVRKMKDKIKEALSVMREYIGGGEAESGGDEKWQSIHKSIKKLTKAKEEILIKINENNLRISARSERARLLKEKLEEMKAELNDISGKFKQKSGQFNIQEISEEKSGLKDKLEAAENRIKEIRNKIEKVNTEESAKKSKLFSLQRDIQMLQNEINFLNNDLNEIKINSTRYETKLEDLEVEIRQELGSIKEVKEERNHGAINTEEAQEKIGQLKRQLDLIGGIDPEIEKEYTETKERFNFLSGQVDDLTKAIESLEKVIKELDITIKERFDKEFKLIAEKFEKYFKILFNGGRAKVIKVMEAPIIDAGENEEASEDEEELNEKKKKEMETIDIKKIKFLQKHNATGLAGVEIQATPPGKKIKTITMLSGGERALTAIALICAIISANPSPFVVLDEVDAALDESNSERLAKILDELSHKTQFIIITHNRASMRRANVLYGVTMGDDGISKLLSIKLDDAKAAANIGKK